jgi:hypothetical protein
VRLSFQADYDLNCDIVSGILRREPSVDFQTGHEAGFEGLEDPEVLGVIVVSQSLPVRDAIEQLLPIRAVSDAEEWRNVIEYLPL